MAKVLEFDAKFEDVGSHGQIETPFTVEEFKEAGYEFEDVLKVTFLNKELLLPFVPSYRCTHSGGDILVGDPGFPTVFLLSFHSNFSRKYKIASFIENDDLELEIFPCRGVNFPIKFKMELYKKKGYEEEFKIYNLIRTNNREDYIDLSDEEFCNFRDVKGGYIKPNILFRSSSPINPVLKRNIYADKALEKYGVKTIINLSNSEEQAKKFPNYCDTYYSKQNVLFLNTNSDVQSYSFGKNIVRAIRFMIESEPPYLIHCMEGQDRTGAFCALMASLLSATKNEIIIDFMKTYENYYRVKKGSEQYDRIIKGEIQKDIMSVRGFSYDTLDLLKHPYSYFNFLDLSNKELEKFVYLLSGGKQNIQNSWG